jgi:hypothetical protein
MKGPGGRKLIKRSLLFIAITWAVTACFELTFHAGELALTAATRAGVVPAGLTGPTSGGKSVTVCTPPAGVAAMPAAQHQAAAQAAWILGARLGFVASARDAESPATAAVQAEERAVDSLARQLGVPEPVFGPLAPASERMTAFARSINQDEGCIAGFLGRRFSAGHGELFRLGAFSGYVQYVRGILPETEPFIDEVRYYGRRAEVDEALWHPLIANLKGVSRAEAQRTLRAAIDAVARQLLPEKPQAGGQQ